MMPLQPHSLQHRLQCTDLDYNALEHEHVRGSSISPTLLPLDVPDVYVHPPEEEQCYTPTFCYFNSNNPRVRDLESMSPSSTISVDLTMLQHQLGTEQDLYPTAQDALAFHRCVMAHDEVVIPRSGPVCGETKREVGPEKFADALLKYEGEGEQNSMGEEAEELGRVAVQEGKRPQNSLPESDVDIAEVVKVRRKDIVSPSPEEEQATIKRNKTFKSRATLALRSITQVGKRIRKISLKEDAKIQDALVSNKQTATEQEGESRSSQQPKLPRRKSRPSALTLIASNSEPSVPQSPKEPILTPSPTTNTPLRPPRSPLRRSVSHADAMTSRPPLVVEPVETAPSSPSYLSLNAQSAPRRQFSFANLQKFFHSTFSPSSSVTDFGIPTVESSPSSAEPETPTDDGFVIPRTYPKPPPVMQSLDSADILEARRASSQSQGQGSANVFVPKDMDTSIGSEVGSETMHTTSQEIASTNRDADGGFGSEMKLDSLCFDSLSFDPESFDVDAFLRGEA